MWPSQCGLAEWQAEAHFTARNVLSSSGDAHFKKMWGVQRFWWSSRTYTLVPPLWYFLASASAARNLTSSFTPISLPSQICLLPPSSSFDLLHSGSVYARSVKRANLSLNSNLDSCLRLSASLWIGVKKCGNICEFTSNVEECLECLLMFSSLRLWQIGQGEGKDRMEMTYRWKRQMFLNNGPD